MFTNVQLPDLTIPNGAAVSNIFNSPENQDDAECVTVYSPAALDALTFSFEVNANAQAVAASPGWVTLQVGDPAADAVPPPAGKARTYYELASAMAYRMKASGNVAADRIFKQSKSVFL